MIKILFLGDIVGKIGRQAVKKILPQWRIQYKPDLVIANAENLAHGRGLTEKTVREMLEAGVDFFTSGNHVWENKGGVEQVLRTDNFPVIRPANYPPRVPGKGYKILKIKKNKILIANLNGRVFFLRENLDCPFRKTKEILKIAKKQQIRHIIIDFHAEATSEKNSFGRYFDGQVSLILGTHTHVPTADQQILPQGTGYITDVGMVGFKEGSLGVNLKEVIDQFFYQMPQSFSIPECGLCQINGVFAIIDNKGQCCQINRLEKQIEI